jgi:UDP-N-acetylmuramate--alanine ligase
VLTDIYAAGEAPVAGVTVNALADAVRRTARCPVHVVPAVDDLPQAVAKLARTGDLIVTLGAGSIGTVADRILTALRGVGVRTGDCA